MRFLMFLLLFTLMVGFNVLQCREVVDVQLTDADAAPKPGDVIKSAGVRTHRHQRKPCVCSGANKSQCCKSQKKLSDLEKNQCGKKGIYNYGKCKMFLSRMNSKAPSTPI
ncbi:hypothetical protein AMEX_G8228 [Astyanax mexicanus]|uniref:Uncharacterized protein n=1 Tax=Astyanax mexicanus TaxID=7994 RepID=A0A8T2M4R6_ASTMX|nr:hypothetical protein AMEX_G8228 [Astyanax mexicanus]